MKKYLHVLIPVLLISIFIACKKKNNDSNSNSTNPPPAPVTTEGGIYAYLKIDGNDNVTYCSFRAKFWESTNTSVYLDPDSVNANGFWLGDQGGFNKFREWFGFFTPPMSMNNPIYWSSTGSSKIPAINYTTSKGMPYIHSSYFSLTSISKSLGVTIAHPNINATKVTYYLAGSGSGSVSKTIVGNSTGVTFTQAELNTLQNTVVGTVIITAINEETISPLAGYNYLFSNSSVLQTTVSIVN